MSLKNQPLIGGVSFINGLNMYRILFLILLPLFFLSGCLATPGDAANRAGHPEQAAELYRKGAEQGDATAALKLGLLLDQGKVKQSKFGSAGKWFDKGCKLGDRPSCHNVGVAYEYGKNGFSKNYKQARNYYTKAAEVGYMQSQYNLASMYSNKYFINDVKGLKWLLIAQSSARKCSGNSLCKWILNDPPGHKNKLIKRMSGQQIKQAEAGASKWISKN
ncbi:MAG: sel1 repeat family protein [Aestuariibacter sp.]|nr:sel1 repeat family protein [Aestuariibacter sp.]